MVQKKSLSIPLLVLLVLSFLVSAPVVRGAELPAREAVPVPDGDFTMLSGAYLLMDGETGEVIHEKNGTARRYPASITKLLTTLLVLENLELTDEVPFSRLAVMSIPVGSSHIGMREGEVLTVEEALHALLLMSANEVANALAERVGGTMEGFAEMMTQRAKELGAVDSHFVNANGLSDEDHYSTAYDVALVARELLGHPVFLEFMGHHFYSIGPTNLESESRNLYQQHKLLNPQKDSSLFREDVIAGKTGYTRMSGNTLVTVARREGRTLITVVLESTGQIYEETCKLLDYGFSLVETPPVLPETAMSRPASPSSSEREQPRTALLSLETSAPLYLRADEDLAGIRTETDLPPVLASTVGTGDVAGIVSYYYGDRLLATRNVVVYGWEEDGRTALSSGGKSPGGSSFGGSLLGLGLKLLLGGAALFLLLFASHVRSKRRQLYWRRRRTGRSTTYY
ncbi:D-alanyl-D-alanine carboxypeptidase family protein [Anaerotalea alkaliphila]|uniref:D-alanyl-D-alanine carboxypeptidase n=1 Tax=Anaerotalea alkaliphila TaxID=2662126 RepID=A0A7X5HXE5_9FIRM|nr:D-alanyl-D-alanine carboxypeptidase family protein [Anaerotalea alkaliphila]NDL68395.1 D-alanyl-D-alanine carboxypeptidase [Anaerotalea alkaliphila]